MQTSKLQLTVQNKTYGHRLKRSGLVALKIKIRRHLFLWNDIYYQAHRYILVVLMAKPHQVDRWLRILYQNIHV